MKWFRVPGRTWNTEIPAPFRRVWTTKVCKTLTAFATILYSFWLFGLVSTLHAKCHWFKLHWEEQKFLRFKFIWVLKIILYPVISCMKKLWFNVHNRSHKLFFTLLTVIDEIRTIKEMLANNYIRQNNFS